jgi:hypothetical protein
MRRRHLLALLTVTLATPAWAVDTSKATSKWR